MAGPKIDLNPYMYGLGANIDSYLLPTVILVDAAYAQHLGAAYAQRLGAAYAQHLGAAYAQRLGAAYAQRLGVAYAQRLGVAYAQRLGVAYAQRLLRVGYLLSATPLHYTLRHCRLLRAHD